MGCASIWMHHWLDGCHRNHLNRDTKQFGFDSWLFLHSFWKHNSKRLVCWVNIHSISVEKHCHLWLRSDEWAGISQAGTGPNSVGLDNPPPPPLSFLWPGSKATVNMRELGFLKQEGGKKKADLTMTPPACPLSRCWMVFRVSPPWVHLLSFDAINPITIVMILTDLFWAICHRRNKSLPLSPGSPTQKYLLGTASKSTVALFSYTTTIHSNT